MYNAFLGVGGVGVRLMAGGQHAVVSPRLTHVNATIVDERDPFSGNGNGTAKNSHDWIMYPGYPDGCAGCMSDTTYKPVSIYLFVQVA